MGIGGGVDARRREVVVVRLGEYTVKSKGTRRWFERLLVRNIRDALSREGLRAEIRWDWGRVYVYGGLDAAQVLRRVFGIKSVSPGVEVEYQGLDDLLAKAEEHFSNIVEGKRFAVRARRSWVEGFTSLDIEKRLGERLLRYAAGVNLENPDVVVYVEVRGRKAFLYTDIIPGYGGLPLGSEGRALALFSGGIDSPVAAWYIMRRGAKVDLVFFNVGGEAYLRAVMPVARTLAWRWSYGYRQRLFVVPFWDVMKALREAVKPGLRHVVLKRLMYRGAEALAKRLGAEALVTGESLGQVASQTMRNLYVTEEAVSIPVFRPLIGFDKDDIVSLARDIGTYEYSILVKEYCGAFTQHPVTHAKLDEVEAEEAKIPGKLLEDALSAVVEMDLVSLGSIEGVEDLEIDEIPPGSVVVDLRPVEKFERWHIPGSVHVEFFDIFENPGSLDADKTYVFVCDEGALSREAALFLRKHGYRAYSLRGGIKRFKRRLKPPSG